MTDLSPKINEALSQLDPANSDHWTDDGLPKTSVVQTIAKDTTIKRSDIQAVRPGFDRDAAKAEQQPVVDSFDDAPAPVLETAPVVAATQQTAPVEPISPAETVEISDEQLLKLLETRVQNAEKKIEDGRAMEANGQLMQNAGHDDLRAARRDKNKYFPPTTEAENIAGYLVTANEERAERVRKQGAGSQLDAARRGGNARGWGRGHARGAFSRQEAARLGFRVPGSPAAGGA